MKLMSALSHRSEDGWMDGQILNSLAQLSVDGKHFRVTHKSKGKNRDGVRRLGQENNHVTQYPACPAHTLTLMVINNAPLHRLKQYLRVDCEHTGRAVCVVHHVFVIVTLSQWRIS